MFQGVHTLLGGVHGELLPGVPYPDVQHLWGLTCPKGVALRV